MSTLKLLMVDDRNLTSDLARAGYRKMGVSVTCVHNFKSTFEQLKEKHYDLLVINLDYTKIDPVRLLDAVKSSKDFLDLPVVVTSVQSNPKIRNQALQHAANLYIEQPVPVHFFIEKVKALLDKQVRSNSRVEVYGRATVLAEGHSTECGIVDISNSGLLLAGSNLSQGKHALVTLNLDGLNRPIKVNAEVIRQVNSEKISSATALKFLDFISDGELRLSRFIEKQNIDSTELKYYF